MSYRCFRNGTEVSAGSAQAPWGGLDYTILYYTLLYYTILYYSSLD